jgi:hypothetical protein
MTKKEYLSQAYHIEQRISAKMEQVQSLRDLATKASVTLSDMPRSPSPNVHRMEDFLCKVVDLEREISSDLCRLIDVKREIMEAIKRIGNPIYRLLLELRYLCYKTWEDIAGELNYDRRYVFKVHDRAIREVDTKRQ